MRKILASLLGLVFALLLPSSCSTAPKNQSLRYLSPEQHDDIKRTFEAPPATGSAEQASDEATLLNEQVSRTSEDCKRANSEVLVSLAHFYGGPEDELSEKELATLKPFFRELHLEANDFIMRLKVDFPRPRPYTYIKDLKPCVSHETSMSYPSGHATLSELDALVLGEIFPARAAKFEKRAVQIAHDRVMAGVHHPTDIAAGRTLAHEIFEDMKKSQKFNSDVDDIKASLQPLETSAPAAH